MPLLIEIAVLFLIIFFAVRLATTGHVDSHKASTPPQHEIVYQEGKPIS